MVKRLSDSTDRGGFAGARWGVLTLAIVLTVAIGFTLIAQGAPPVPQPVAFNHLKHTEDLKLNCEFCHAYLKDGAHAGLPGARTCRMCHTTPQGTSAEAARVTTLIEQGDPLIFNKLFRLAPHVFYTHRRHVGIAELECYICHGNIAETERPPDRALVKIDMDFCMDCHRDAGQTLDCNACHR
jgi:hypothetical protein